MHRIEVREVAEFFNNSVPGKTPEVGGACMRIGGGCVGRCVRVCVCVRERDRERERERECPPSPVLPPYPHTPHPHTPPTQTYREYRNALINLYRRDVHKHLSWSHAKRVLAGDAAAILHIWEFCDRWGLINFQAPHPSAAGVDAADVVPDGACVL